LAVPKEMLVCLTIDDKKRTREKEKHLYSINSMNYYENKNFIQQVYRFVYQISTFRFRGCL